MSDVRIGAIANLFKLSVSRVRQLADEGRIPSRRTDGGHRVFDLTQVAAASAMASATGTVYRSDPADFDRRYPLQGLAEHEVWREVRESVGLDPSNPAVHVIEYALEEMVNNAISHSGGSVVRVMVRATPEALSFVVADDGIGALERLRSELGLADVLSAIQELSKGKRTTEPEEHSGQGIFFTSKAVDRFLLLANGWKWTVDSVVVDQTVEKLAWSCGTVVACVLDRASGRTMEQVFGAYTRGIEFDRTTPAVKLASYGTRLVSRSEAKLLLEGLEQFAEVDMDFDGVDAVGQAFVDEVFRVWTSRHPEVALRPVNMNEAVRFMVERGLPGART
jgi:anti-sigma regulatory factor (Ser/Thr protein kinase)